MATQLSQTKKKNSREWIYAKKPSGKLYAYRQWVGYSLLIFLISAPFIKINNNPLVMFNIIERKFSIFGTVFYPQDLHIFVFGMLIIMVFIVLFTSLFGRVWCGWTCPQTIFMELVFRRIEYWIEGDWNQQKKRDNGPDTDERAFKKLLKHVIFLLISFLISNLFLSYIIGVDSLYKIITSPVEEHLIGFLSIIVFSLTFYAVFAHVREIVCTTICPYGRLQGVLLDKDSLTVAYNTLRGEPRGKQQKQGEPLEKGDCIDCKICVHVCPTGIDIRNGIQLECVNCTACIDACDTVMDKIGKPQKLIGFYSLGQFETPDIHIKKNNKRKYFYIFILLILVAIFSFMIINRSQIDGAVLRATGTSYQIRDNGEVSNLYTIELMNKSGKDLTFLLKAQDPTIQLQLVNNITDLKKDSKAKLSFFLIQPSKNIKKYKTDVKIDIISDQHKQVYKTLKTTFVAPPQS